MLGLLLGRQVPAAAGQREVFEAKLQAARAEATQQHTRTFRSFSLHCCMATAVGQRAIHQCNEKFLMYGYAAEYKAIQQKTLGERAPKDAVHKG